MRPRLPRLLLCLPAALFGAPCAAQDPAWDSQIKPFLQRFCNRCHNAEVKRGGVDLARFDRHADAAAAGPLWDGVRQRVQAHEMPPERARQPGIEPRRRFLRAVAALVPKSADCNQLATDGTQNFYKGHVMSRRLNRA